MITHNGPFKRYLERKKKIDEDIKAKYVKREVSKYGNCKKSCGTS